MLYVYNGQKGGILNIQNKTKRQFEKTLHRESITVNDYYSDTKTYKVFFRRGDRGTAPQGKMRLFYLKETDISIGTVYIYDGECYLVTSKDAQESGVYYTSVAIRCETLFTVKYKEKYIEVPFAVEKEQYVTVGNQNLNIVAGSVTIYTGLNEYVREMTISKKYVNFGGTYEITNIFYNNGLAYIYMERDADMPDTYSLVYDGLTTLDITAGTYQLSYSALKNGNIVSTPTLSYATSDESVATVDDAGQLSLITSGSVTITATWVDGDNTICQTDILIEGSEEPSFSGTITITGNKELKFGYARNYTANFFDNNGNAVTGITPIWTFTNCTFENSIKKTITDNKIALCVDDDNLIGETFTLNVVDADNKYQATKMDIQIVEGF